jgi:hypothetical protein
MFVGLRCIAALALSLACGCYSLGIMQEPKVLPAGKVRGVASLALQPTSDAPAPFVQAGLRVGLGGRTEAQVALLSFIQGLKVGVGVAPYESALFDLFLMPNYRYFWNVVEEAGWIEGRSSERRVHALALPMLGVFHIAGHDLFVGPDLHAGRRDQRGFLALGGHFGVATPLRNNHVSLIPEISVLGVLIGQRQGIDPSSGDRHVVLARGKLMVELGFAISFGGAH